MLSPGRALALHVDSGKELPRVPALKALYDLGVRPRQGETIMIAGRSGSQKSGLALFWTDEMNLPTLYFSADMNAFTAASRIASKRTDQTTEQVERGFANPETKGYYLEQMSGSNIQFSFGKPITWRQIYEEIEAWVDLHDEYPKVIVYDNLMDFEGGDSKYEVQMDVIAGIGELGREIGATSIIMHHATDKGWEAKADPWQPPSRDQIKNGLSEKPELSLTVALDPHNLSYRIACVKQRMGPSDPTARTYAVLRCEPDKTMFHHQNFAVGG